MSQLPTYFSIASALLLLLCRSDMIRGAEPRADFYVACNGSDTWSGTLPAPNAGQTDGPFATIARARDAVRGLKAHGLTQSVSVVVRGGTYFLAKPIRFGPEDSGTERCPVRYLAYPGEKPVLSGGRRITGWATKDGKLYTAHVPEVAAGKWHFKQLRVGDKRQIRARYPNYDPANPFKGGWLFAAQPSDWQGGFGTCVGCIHNAGDYLEYEIDVPAEAEYDYWVYVSMRNEPHTTSDISGNTVITVDGGEAIPLNNMADTGGWDKFEWRRAARVQLAEGRHRLRWTNVKGGGVGFDAFALTDDLGWRPEGPTFPSVQGGRHLIAVQAEEYAKGYGPELKVSGAKFESKTKLHCDPDVLKAWPKSPNPEIHIFPRWGWVNGIVPVTKVDAERSTLHLTDNWPEKIWLGNRFYVENVLEELDAPGEWYLDRDTGTVYLLPEHRDFAREEVVGAVLDRVVEFRGGAGKGQFVSHITLSGFTFADTDYSSTQVSWYAPDDSAIWLVAASHCRIERCKFRNIGGWATTIKPGSAHNAFVGNEVAHAGQGGIFIDGRHPSQPNQPCDPGVRPRSTLVSNNHIHHCGVIYKHVAGVYLWRSDHNTISYNLIHDMPRYAISIKHDSDGNVIERNEVRRTNLETNDTGAIELYVNRKPTIIRENIIADVIGLKTMPNREIRTPFFCWGIYLDGYSSNATITRNIICRNYRGGIMIGAGSNNVIENNILVGSKTYQVEFYNSRPDGKDNVFRRNIMYFDDPDAAVLHLLKWGKGFVASDHNLICCAEGESSVRTAGQKERRWDEWVKLGQDVHSVLADPLFVDMARDDFRLKPESPAFRLGFEPIDAELIGLERKPVGLDRAE